MNNFIKNILIIFFSILIANIYGFENNHLVSNRYYDQSKSHHTPDGFTNPYLSPENQTKSFSSFWKMMKEERPKNLGVQKVIFSDISAINS